MKITGSFLKIEDDKEKIKTLAQETDQIHFDIMDGIFTENKTLEIDKVKENLVNLKSDIDIHLMVKNVKEYVDKVLIFNPQVITFHIEASENPNEFINYIKGKKVKVGIAINPKTNLEKIYPYLKSIDLVLIMSVQAGKGGQKFIDISSRIDDIYNYRKKNKLNYIIEVDGGINNETIKKVKKADLIVVGSYITDSNNYKKQVEELRKCYNE
ncbi:MAG: ribulose-phosphate 3-epimerase [Bacilli bacterium]|nr:ribulose-phosphate 3-epimerase [Bacilli bacterium]